MKHNAGITPRVLRMLVLGVLTCAGFARAADAPLSLPEAQRRAVERSRLIVAQDAAVTASREMAVAVIIAGLLPIMFGSGTGSEVMRRIAAPMVGGMITAPLLSMFVIPAAYLLMRRPREAKARQWAFWRSRRATA